MIILTVARSRTNPKTKKAETYGEPLLCAGSFQIERHPDEGCWLHIGEDAPLQVLNSYEEVIAALKSSGQRPVDVSSVTAQRLATASEVQGAIDARARG